MEPLGDGYRLTSGRTFYANGGIVGIAPDLQLREGYDGGVNTEGYDYGAGYSDAGWTAAERAELAAYMIELWTQFAAGQEKRVMVRYII